VENTLANTFYSLQGQFLAFSAKNFDILENFRFWQQIRYFPHFVANHEDVAQTTSDTVQGCSEVPPSQNGRAYSLLLLK
jgi:hypothetical protein